MSAHASIYLDTRKKNKKKLYPVKLRVYHQGDRKLYPLDITLSEEDFKKSYNSLKPKGIHAEYRQKILDKENEAKKILENMRGFSFAAFEQKMFKHVGFGKDVYAYFENAIETLGKRGQIGNKTNYQCAMKSFQAYKQKLSFFDITPSFLHDYEKWMVDNGKSLTTVGIYVRTLKAIFNQAIDMGDVNREIYPFGKRKYVVPAPPKVLKALDEDELAILASYPLPEGSHLEKARDFFFISYGLDGLNVKDIANLRWSNIDMENMVIHVIREKTKNTTRSNQVMQVHDIVEDVAELIKKYAVPGDGYVFDIYKEKMTPEEKYRAAANFTRFINQHMKTICKQAIGRDDISTYWARHSAVTVMSNNGVPIQVIKEKLGHRDLRTTMGYHGRLKGSITRDATKGLFNFKKKVNPENE